MKKFFRNTIENNLWKFTVHSITNKRAYMTFLAIYLLTMPETNAQFIGLMTLIGQVAGFILEIPSGYISDRIGHKKALVIARILLVFSTLIYLLANSKGWFIWGSILHTAGWAFVSGTDKAFMHDTLRELGKDDQYSKIMGRISSIGFAIPTILILILSTIADSNFKAAFGIALIIDLIGLVAVLLLKQPSVAEEKVEEITIGNFLSVLSEWKNIDWVKYIMILSLALSIHMGATMGFKNTYQELIGFSISMIGVLWAISRVLISGLLLINDRIHKILSFKSFILLQTLIYSLSFIGLGLAHNIWVIAILFIVPTATTWGLGAASSQYYLEFIKNSKAKATLLSVNALIENLMTGIVGLITGWLIVNHSYPYAFMVLGLVLITVVGVGLFYLPSRKPWVSK